MAKWWNTWGATVLWCLSAIGSAGAVIYAVDQKFDDIALRLQRIEIVLGIDPLSKDVLRTVATEAQR